MPQGHSRCYGSRDCTLEDRRDWAPNAAVVGLTQPTDQLLQSSYRNHVWLTLGRNESRYKLSSAQLKVSTRYYVALWTVVRRSLMTCTNDDRPTTWPSTLNPFANLPPAAACATSGSVLVCQQTPQETTVLRVLSAGRTEITSNHEPDYVGVNGRRLHSPDPSS